MKSIQWNNSRFKNVDISRITMPSDLEVSYRAPILNFDYIFKVNVAVSSLDQLSSIPSEAYTTRIWITTSSIHATSHFISSSFLSHTPNANYFP